VIIKSILVILSTGDSWSGGFYVSLIIFVLFLIIFYFMDQREKKIRIENKRKSDQDEEERNRKSNWEYGVVPIIDVRNGRVNNSKEYRYGTRQSDVYKNTENKLKKIPEYCYLVENGSNLLYKSLFIYMEEEKKQDTLNLQNQKNESDELNKFSGKGKIIPNMIAEEIDTFNYYVFSPNQRINAIASKNGFKIIEYLSLNEIKTVANEIKRKLQEEINQNEKIEKEKKEKQLIIERWNKISNSYKFEINEIDVRSFSSGIYLINCIPSNHIYVGSSENMALRKNQHLQQLRNNSHHSYRLQESYNQYGESNLKFYALELIDLNSDIVNSSRILKHIEQDYINQYRPEFNIELDAFGRKHYQ
jgi:hypothetical protein